MIGIRFISVLAFALILVSAPVSGWAAAEKKAASSEAVHEPTTTPESRTSPSDVGGPAFVTDEAENPVEAAEEKGEGGLPQLNLKTFPGQIFWLLVMFTILYTAFSTKVLPGIGAVVDSRENKIKGDLAEAEILKNQVAAIQVAYEKNLEQARAAASQAVQDVDLASKKKASEQVELFRKRADAEMNAAEARVEGVKERAMDGMNSVAAEVASIAAEKITGIGTDMQNAKAIVETIAGKAKAA